jgi:hypothetical protein
VVSDDDGAEGKVRTRKPIEREAPLFIGGTAVLGPGRSSPAAISTDSCGADVGTLQCNPTNPSPSDRTPVERSNESTQRSEMSTIVALALLMGGRPFEVSRRRKHQDLVSWISMP